ncbi:hypothetical protein IV203_024943 [Nitzschia inconspicua]|uniref:Uncharacterized protein n=1 Tax=Nitzschia inconspicua TaxID=303405 RepID=A0A9K3KAE8_9STRA|nr:hypothetical protein IV203_024943 [Nitzschia inconspicua]
MSIHSSAPSLELFIWVMEIYQTSMFKLIFYSLKIPRLKLRSPNISGDAKRTESHEVSPKRTKFLLSAPKRTKFLLSAPKRTKFLLSAPKRMKIKRTEAHED